MQDGITREGNLGNNRRPYLLNLSPADHSGGRRTYVLRS
nr:MAG TPA: hypothetical protein [Caudoviricetes sp.]DAM08056.1 MAG TPA: hypothetical protein [Caudoviricetes sp.]